MYAVKLSSERKGYTEGIFKYRSKGRENNPENQKENVYRDIKNYRKKYILLVQAFNGLKTVLRP